MAPAVAIPQRIRSHFEAQDLLETGGAQMYAASTGWLNRTLAGKLSPAAPSSALSIGAQEPLILRGPVQAESWSPGGRITPNTNRVANALMDLYAEDALLGPAPRHRPEGGKAGRRAQRRQAVGRWGREGVCGDGGQIPHRAGRSFHRRPLAWMVSTPTRGKALQRDNSPTAWASWTT